MITNDTVIRDENILWPVHSPLSLLQAHKSVCSKNDLNQLYFPEHYHQFHWSLCAIFSKFLSNEVFILQEIVPWNISTVCLNITGKYLAFCQTGKITKQY